MTTFQLNIEIPVIHSIDSYVLQDIKTFHSFKSTQGEISCYVKSNSTSSIKQVCKIEQISMSTNIRKGYQTKQFNVDNLYNGLGDKQAKQSHFQANGALN